MLLGKRDLYQFTLEKKTWGQKYSLSPAGSRINCHSNKLRNVPCFPFCLTVIAWFWKYYESTLIIKLTCQNAYYNYCRTYMNVRLCK